MLPPLQRPHPAQLREPGDSGPGPRASPPRLQHAGRAGALPRGNEEPERSLRGGSRVPGLRRSAARPTGVRLGPHGRSRAQASPRPGRTRRPGPGLHGLHGTPGEQTLFRRSGAHSRSRLRNRGHLRIRMGRGSRTLPRQGRRLRAETRAPQNQSDARKPRARWYYAEVREIRESEADPLPSEAVQRLAASAGSSSWGIGRTGCSVPNCSSSIRSAVCASAWAARRAAPRGDLRASQDKRDVDRARARVALKEASSRIVGSCFRAVFGFLGVALGAFGAHSLSAALSKSLAVFHTAARTRCITRSAWSRGLWAVGAASIPACATAWLAPAGRHRRVLGEPVRAFADGSTDVRRDRANRPRGFHGGLGLVRAAPRSRDSPRRSFLVRRDAGPPHSQEPGSRRPHPLPEPGFKRGD